MSSTQEKFPTRSDTLRQRQRTKRRDLFETAPISRNLLEADNHEQQYTSQIKHITQKNRKQSSKSIQERVQSRATEQNIATRIDLSKYLNQNQSKNQISQPVNNQNADNFIFQGSSSQQQQQQPKGKLQNSPKQQKQSKIIFQGSSQGQQRLDTVNIQDEPDEDPNTIQLFGQKVHVSADCQVVQQQDSKKQQKNNNKLQQQKSANSQEQNPSKQKMRQLLRATSPMDENTFAKMKLIRRKQVMGGTLFILRLQSNMRFILAAKHVSSQTYILSQSAQSFQENGSQYIGKIKASFFGNELSLFDRGLNPSKAQKSGVLPRQLICTVVTHSQPIMDQVKPRDFSVYLLDRRYHYYKDLVGVKPYQDQHSLNKLYHQFPQNKNKIILYENRISQWSQKDKMHSLNMKGRAQFPSIKNFILQSPNQKGRQIMLLGKMDKNQFSFDIHYPLSPFIGMVIAISSFTHNSW